MSEKDSPSQGQTTVSLADEEGVKRILVETVFGLWGLVNNLTRVGPSRRERCRVTIFGSARARSGTWVYDEVKPLAGALAEMGCDIVTVLEAMLVWQLLQVRHLHDTPLLFAGEMWAELVDWARRYMLRLGFELAHPEDMAIPRCVNTTDEAIAILREHHARWQLTQGGPL